MKGRVERVKVAESLSTGKLLANMLRATPKASIVCRTKGRMLSTVHFGSTVPSPEIFTTTLSAVASCCMPRRHRRRPSSSRSTGIPAWLRMIKTSG